MKLRLFVELLLVVGGFLAIYLAVALSFAALYRDYVLPLVFLGIILIVFGVWLINPLGIWSKLYPSSSKFIEMLLVGFGLGL